MKLGRMKLENVWLLNSALKNFQFLWKLSNFELSNLKLSNFSFFPTGFSNYIYSFEKIKAEKFIDFSVSLILICNVNLLKSLLVQYNPDSTV